MFLHDQEYIEGSKLVKMLMEYAPDVVHRVKTALGGKGWMKTMLELEPNITTVAVPGKNEPCYALAMPGPSSAIPGIAGQGIGIAGQGITMDAMGLATLMHAQAQAMNVQSFAGPGVVMGPATLSPEFLAQLQVAAATQLQAAAAASA